MQQMVLFVHHSVFLRHRCYFIETADFHLYISDVRQQFQISTILFLETLTTVNTYNF